MIESYLVWSDDMQQGIVLADYQDARYAATGETNRMGVSSLADAWRERYGEDGEQYEIKKVQITTKGY